MEPRCVSVTLSVCRTERETLETSLFELQQQINQIQSRREQLESENQNLRLRADSMMGKSERKTSISTRAEELRVDVEFVCV